MTSPTGRDEAASALDQGIQDLCDAVDGLRKDYQDFCSRVDRLMGSASLKGGVAGGLLLGPVGLAAGAMVGFLCEDDVQGALGCLGEAVQGILDYADGMLGSSTPIYSLVDVGLQWIGEVQEEISNQTALLHQSGTLTNPNAAFMAWSGTSCDVYYEKRFNQWTAAGATADNAAVIGEWLITVASNNADFFVAVAEPVAEVAGDIAEIAINLASVVGLVEAIDTLAEAIGNSLDNIHAIAAAAEENIANTLESIGGAEALLYGNNAYPGGQWPKMVNK